MASKLTAEDLSIISKHIGGVFNERMSSIENMVSKSVKGLQEVNEINHMSLFEKIQEIKNELNEVKLTGKETHNFTSLTNGRVTRLEGLVDGEKDSNNKIVKGKEGITNDIREIKQYRFFYKEGYRMLIWISLLSALFIKESRDYVFSFVKIFKGI